MTESVYVVDQAAYEEPVYEEVPVYETYGVEICGVCGAELYSAEEVSAHSETHIDWETLEIPFIITRTGGRDRSERRGFRQARSIMMRKVIMKSRWSRQLIRKP